MWKAQKQKKKFTKKLVEIEHDIYQGNHKKSPNGNLLNRDADIRKFQ